MTTPSPPMRLTSSYRPPPPQGLRVSTSCDARHGAPATPRLAWVMEIFLLLWDEVDDWVGACLAVLRRMG